MHEEDFFTTSPIFYTYKYSAKHSGNIFIKYEI